MLAAGSGGQRLSTRDDTNASLCSLCLSSADGRWQLTDSRIQPEVGAQNGLFRLQPAQNPRRTLHQ